MIFIKKGADVGWKTLKERYGIRHLVHVTNEGICVGSDMVPDLITIDVKSGQVSTNATFSRFADETYPALMAASKEEILNAIEAPDVFNASIEVFTYEDGQILKQVCETPGWPNVTHEGHLMFENTHSTDMDKVVCWAKKDAAAAAAQTKRWLQDAENSVAELRIRLAQHEAALGRLRERYPDESEIKG